jgi:hypothetical protein
MIVSTPRLHPANAEPGRIHVAVGTATSRLRVAVIANGMTRANLPSPASGPSVVSTMCTVRGAEDSIELSRPIDNLPHTAQTPLHDLSMHRTPTVPCPSDKYRLKLVIC